MTDLEVTKLFLNRMSNPFSVEHTDDYIFITTDKFWFDDVFHQDRDFRFKFSRDGTFIDYTTVIKGDD